MRRLRNEQGSSLILLIGIVAALVVMSAALVTLLGNVQHNTSRVKQQSKAFNVTEAGLDASLYQLALRWPKTSAETPTFDYTSFRGNFDAGEFPSPVGDEFLRLQFYDNSDTNGDKVIGYKSGSGWDAAYDANHDGYIYVEAQGAVGSRIVRINALAMQATFDLQVPRGVALYASQDLWMHGGGTSVGVSVPPPGGVTSAYIGDTLHTSGKQDFSSDITPVVASDPTVVNFPKITDVLPAEILNGLIETAKATGRYFTSESAAEAGSVDPSTGQAWSGLVVVDGANVTINASGVINGDGMGGNPPPGVIIVLNGDLNFHGTPIIYGLVYNKGGYTDIGNATVQGMVACDGSANIGGSEQVMYNDNVIVNLNRVVTLTVKIVPNTWRELSPRKPWPTK